MDLNFSILQLSEIIGSVGGAVLIIQKVLKNIQRSKESYANQILKDAKEEMSLVKSKLESRIEATRAELKSLEFNVSRDMMHMKEQYSSEIRNLGEKLELLRIEIREQHTGILALLTRLVDK